MAGDARFEGVHGTLDVRRPRPGLVVLTLIGVDAGELGRAPFTALEDDFSSGPVEIFIDARHGRAASVEVSGEWAMFFRAHRARIQKVHMLTTTRFLQVSAELVRSFALLEERMQILTDAAEFERCLGERILA